MADPFRPPKDIEPDEALFVRECAEAMASLRRATVLCPPPSVVGVAAAGSLPPEEQASVSAHIASCFACQALAGAMSNREALTASDPKDGEEARIRTRIAAEEDREAPRAPAAAAGRHPWRLLAAAATLLLAAGLGTWALRLRSENRRLAAAVVKPRPTSGASAEEESRRRLEEAARTAAYESRIAALERQAGSASKPQGPVPVLDLEPAGAFRSSEGEKPLFRVPPSTPLVAVVLNSSSHDAALPHTLEILDGGGRLIWKGEGLKENASHVFALTIPRELLHDGDYRLRLFVERRGRREIVETYELRIRG